MPAGQATNKKYADDGLLIVAILAILLVLLHVYNVSGRNDLFSWWFPILNVIAFILLAWRIYLHWNTRTLKLRWYASQALLMLLMLLALISELFFHTILSSIRVTEHTSMSSVIYQSIFIFFFWKNFPIDFFP
ncbi:MAG: hypothetical protein IPO25_06420 [Saprospiraceae bacterium]|nr:hypothetical protein [Saprospiraceae bacterium]